MHEQNEYLSVIKTIRYHIDEQFQFEVTSRLVENHLFSKENIATSSSLLASAIKKIRALPTESLWKDQYQKEVLLSQFIIGITLFPALEMAIYPLLDKYSRDIPRTYKDVKSLWNTIAYAIPSLRTHSFRHFFNHPKFLFGTIQARNLFHKLLGSILPFDPKADLGNLPGILWEEAIITPNPQIAKVESIFWNIGPTATVGNQISPEAECFCSQIASIGVELCNSVLEGWIYINLQNRLSRHEKLRSNAIEGISKRWRKNVMVASIPVDAPFYLVTYDTSKVSLADAKNHLLVLLRDSAIFNIRSKSWFFFSLITKQEQDKWIEVSSTIIEAAYRCIDEISSKYIDTEKHKIFQQLVLYGLCRAWQGWSSAHIAKQLLVNDPSQEKKVSILSTITCREGVDRGGAMNGGLIALLTEDNVENAIKKALLVMWGRPILFRGRLNEIQRCEGFFLIVEHFSSLKIVRTFLEKSFRTGHDTCLSLTPY